MTQSESTTPTNPKKRQRLSIQQKRDVINKLKHGSSVANVAQQFGIGHQTVRDIKKKETELDRYQISYGSTPERKSLKRPTGDNLDQATYTWFKAQRAYGAEVNSYMLKVKALEFNRILDGPATFKATNGWLEKFLLRHAIRMKKISGERGTADEGSALEYCSKTIPQILEDEQITLSQLYNADETGLVYRKTAQKSYILPTEQNPSGRKQPKERVTLLVGCNAEGTDKLPLIMIGKSAKPRCFNKVNPSSIPLTYLNQRKAWMDATLFKKIFLEHYVPHIKKFLRRNMLPQRAVILVDNATSHDELEKDGIKVIFLPPNTTSLIQPMDQGPIAAVKKRYISFFMLAAMNRDDGVDLNTFLKKWNLLQTSVAIGNAWSQITEETLKNSWNPLLKDVRVQAPASEPLPAPEEEITTPEAQAWLDEEVPTCAELTEAAIVEALLNPEPEVIEVIPDEEDEQPEQPTYSLNEAITVSEQLLDTLMAYDHFTSTDSVYFASLIDRLRRQRQQQTSKQTTLESFMKRC
jgi:hypothetical protein